MSLRIALSIGFLSLVAVAAKAEDCGFLGLDPLNLLDRQIYYQEPSGGAWTLLAGPIETPASRRITLAYVFREQFAKAHSGVIVIKSARNRQLNEPQRSLREKPVALVRNGHGYCGRTPSFGEKSVSAKSYDDYHDQGLGGSESSTILSFHAGYIGRRNQCKKTNDNSPDSVIPVDGRSNRGQFSFDPRVVSDGTYSQVLAWGGVTSASASSENLEDQRVEIKPYTTVANMPSCLRFDLPVQKRNSFLRVNDLEGLVWNQSSYVRANEREWKLVP